MLPGCSLPSQLVLHLSCVIASVSELDAAIAWSWNIATLAAISAAVCRLHLSDSCKDPLRLDHVIWEYHDSALNVIDASRYCISSSTVCNYVHAERIWAHQTNCKPW